jgi:hypothetical protein
MRFVKDGKPVSVRISVQISFRLEKMNLARGEIFGDTMGTNFSSYLATVLGNVQTHWCKLIPGEVGLKKSEVTVQFTVFKDGQLTDMQMTSGSGDAVFDQLGAKRHHRVGTVRAFASRI